MTPQQRFLEDFEVGEQFSSPKKTLTDAHFVLFSAITGDSHPIHDDHRYAQEKGFEGRVAHGLLLVASTALGATSMAHALEDSMIALVEQRSRFRRPAIIGDTVHTEFKVSNLEIRDDVRGLLTLTTELVNQSGETLMEGEHRYLIRRHPEAND